MLKGHYINKVGIESTINVYLFHLMDNIQHPWKHKVSFIEEKITSVFDSNLKSAASVYMQFAFVYLYYRSKFQLNINSNYCGFKCFFILIYFETKADNSL